MAAMNVKHIEAMITSMKIAPEVCMANLTFFLKEDAIPEIEAWLIIYLSVTEKSGFQQEVYTYPFKLEYVVTRHGTINLT